MIHWKLKERAEATIQTKELIKASGQDPENFCLVPFTTIILEPDGSVGMCRHKGTKFPIGNIKENSIWEIWNGPKAQQWRREFLEGKPGFCATETKHRHCQHCPENNKLLPLVDFNEVQTKRILKFTANFNGKCNLKCQMCDVWQMPNGLYDEINFWQEAEREIFPFIKEMDLLSGEPFIQKDTYRLIDIIAPINPSCRWMFTTNMHWKLTDHIKGQLDRIDIKSIVMSIDSLNKETYHKIRYPGDLDFVLKNVSVMKEYLKTRSDRGMNSTNLVLNFLVQKDNWHEIHEVIRYCEKNELIPLITFLYEPQPFSLLTLPEEERVRIADELISSFHKDDIVIAMKVIQPLLDSMNRLNRIAVLEMLSAKRSV